MKRLFYILIVLLVLSCEKEELTQRIIHENLYAIKDDPTDPVKHRIYELYEKYNVPIYFNDTVGKYFVKNDVNGNPYYRYEMLDYNWKFYSDNSNKVKYKYFYQTDPERQMISLEFTDRLLNEMSAPLRPYAIFLVDSVYYEEKDKGIKWLIMGSQFRLGMFAKLPDVTRLYQDSLIDQTVRGLISLKISNFQNELDKFHAVCKSEWYDREWKNDLGVDVGEGPFIFTELRKKQLMQGTIWDAPWTEEQVETARKSTREAIGSYGFVGGGTASQQWFSPDDTGRDLDQYMTEILSCDREEFTRRWGSCPLVMKKYQLLYDLLKDKLDYEL